MADSHSTQDGLTKALTSISERASLLVREEIELAKAEVKQQATVFGRGAGVAIAFAVFAVFGLIFLLEALAWLISDLFFADDIWVGFLIVAILLFVLAGVSAFIANKWLRSNPTPTMAIGEATKIKETVISGGEALVNPDKPTHVAGSTPVAPVPPSASPSQAAQKTASEVKK